LRKENTSKSLPVIVALMAAWSAGPVVADSGDWASMAATARSEMSRGDLDSAETDFKAALSSAEHSGAVEPGLVNCLCGLALVYHKRGNVAESERLYELAMRNLESLVGRTSPRFADYMPDLAWLYNEHGKPDKADFLFKNALAIRQQTYGDNDQGAVPLMMQYAKFLRANGRTAEASEFETHAKVILQKAAG
jgi:tetratricopeptide (TPR) repeat protein